MNNTIISRDVHYDFSTFIISYREKKSTTNLVLAEIIKIAEENKYIVSKDIVAYICDTLSIATPNYRKSLRRLIKLNLIKREGEILILNIKFHSPITSITIKQ